MPASQPGRAPSARDGLIPFSALSASYFAHIGFFNPYLPLWLKDLGLSLLAISVLTSVQAATRLFAPYGWGWLSDHTGERVRLLRYCAAVALAASFGLWFSGGTAWIAVVLLLMFTHTSSMMPMNEAAMAHLVSGGGSFDTKRYGRVRLWGSAGFLVTVFLAGAWFEHFGMAHFPMWTSLTLALVVASVCWMPDMREPVVKDAPAVSVLPILRQPVVQWLFASLFFHVLSHMSVYVFFSLYLDSLGYSKTMIGVGWAISVVVEIAWFFTQSRWLPLLSLSGWLVVAGAAMVLRMGITASAAAFLPLLLLAQALHALTFAAHHSVCIALISHHFPGRLRGRGQALYTVVGYGFPGVLGGLAGGVVSSHFGLASVFQVTVITSLVGTACAWQVWRTRHPAHG